MKGESLFCESSRRWEGEEDAESEVCLDNPLTLPPLPPPPLPVNILGDRGNVPLEPGPGDENGAVLYPPPPPVICTLSGRFRRTGGGMGAREEGDA